VDTRAALTASDTFRQSFRHLRTHQLAERPVTRPELFGRAGVRVALRRVADSNTEERRRISCLEEEFREQAHCILGSKRMFFQSRGIVVSVLERCPVTGAVTTTLSTLVSAVRSSLCDPPLHHATVLAISTEANMQASLRPVLMITVWVGHASDGDSPPNSEI